MTFSMGSVLNFGQMALNMKDTTATAASMVLGAINGPMAQSTQGIGTKTKFMGSAPTSGSMVEVTRANGDRTTWKVSESTGGKMGVST